MSNSVNQAIIGDVIGEPIEARRAWQSSTLGQESDWVTRLEDAEIEDLYAVASRLPADRQRWPGLDPEGFATSRLRRRFASIVDEIANGKGFVLLRGLDPEDPERARRVFWVIGNLLGAPVMQNARGEVLSEVMDRFAGAVRGVDTRGYESNDELRFHCDGGDCIGLSCVRQAPTGGDNGLVSLAAIYNELLAHTPEHLETLCRGFPLYVRKEKEVDGHAQRSAKISDRRVPVFAVQDGLFSAWLNITLAELAAKVSGTAMQAEETEALECLEEVAERPDMKLSFRQRPGDVLWIHNLAVMHRRDRYQDASDPNSCRMLYRMWTNLHQPRNVIDPYRALRQGIQGPAPLIAGP